MTSAPLPWTAPDDGPPTRLTRVVEARGRPWEIAVTAQESERSRAVEVLDAVESWSPYCLRDGWVFDMPWGPLRLVDTPAGFEATTPDYERLGGTWTNDVTLHLRLERAQLEFVTDRALGTEPEVPTFTDFLVTEQGADVAPQVYLERTAGTKPGDSGWYLGIVRFDRERGPLESHRVCDLLRLRPSLLPVLAVARGWMVFATGDRVTSVNDTANRQVWPPE